MIFAKKSYLYIGGCFILFLLAFASSYFFVKNSSVFQKKIVQPVPTDEPIEVGEFPEDSIFTTLLIGYGGAGHDGGTLTDSIILIEADPVNKKAAIISIPRDLWIPSLNDKINAAYAIDPAGNLTKSVVSQIIGANVDYYAAVDFGGFMKIINSLGKIEVNVPKTFDDYFYPVKGLENETCGISAEEIADLHSKYSGFELEKQFTCRYEHIRFNQGPTTIDGETALKFVRSRHGDGDFGRSERQFAVLEAINKKLISLEVLSNTGKLLDTLFGMVKTDLSIVKIKEIYQILGDSGGYSVTKIHLNEENTLVSGKGSQGQYILVPKKGINNYTEIQNFIRFN